MNLLDSLLPDLARADLVAVRKALGDVIQELVPEITERVLERVRQTELRRAVQAIIEPQLAALRREIEDRVPVQPQKVVRKAKKRRKS